MQQSRLQVLVAASLHASKVFSVPAILISKYKMDAGIPEAKLYASIGCSIIKAKNPAYGRQRISGPM